MARSSGRAQRCRPQDAQSRYRHAVKFFEVAEIAAGEHDEDGEYASVAVSSTRRNTASSTSAPTT